MDAQSEATHLIFLGTVFYSDMKTLQMQTIREGKVEDIHVSAFKSFVPSNPVLANPAKRLKQREYISWVVCFGIVSFLTGLLKFLKVGITMDSITSTLFYFSLVGLFYFLYKIFSLSKNKLSESSGSFHGLN